MATLTIVVPDGKESDLLQYAIKLGGRVVKKDVKADTSETDEDEVTHGVFFGENIKRVIKAFKKS